MSSSETDQDPKENKALSDDDSEDEEESSTESSEEDSERSSSYYSASSESESESSQGGEIIETENLDIMAAQQSTGQIRIHDRQYFAPNMVHTGNISTLKGRDAWNFINPSGVNPKDPKTSIFDFDINKELADNEEERPWRKEGADITDWFNYGFNEQTWEIYRLQMQKIIKRRHLKSKILSLDIKGQN